MEILRLRACQWCWQPFVLCRACDRGHVYCSLPCRHAGRARSLRAAGRRHQQSPEGRLDHRDHQRAYRARCRARVTHQTSPTPRSRTTWSILGMLIPENPIRRKNVRRHSQCRTQSGWGLVGYL